MNFKKTYKPKNGYTPISKIGECSLKILEFGMIELDGGDLLEYYTDDKETAFIMLEGHCDVEANGEKWENIGNRSTVLKTEKPRAFICRVSKSLQLPQGITLKLRFAPL